MSELLLPASARMTEQYTGSVTAQKEKARLKQLREWPALPDRALI
jgi:hypothetical protein